MDRTKPYVSIITVVLNNAKGLFSTLQSLFNLRFQNIEIIVIDGASTDGTVDVIQKYQDYLSYWISEPDKGIYDAMNKGLARATGEWVNFMNAGDLFFDPHVLSKIFTAESVRADVIYGDSIARYPAFQAMRKATPPEDLWKGMVSCHQAMFFRTNLINEAGYKTEGCFSADFEMVLRLFMTGKHFEYIPETVAVFDTRGLSNLNMLKSARSNFEILRSFRPLSAKEKGFHQRFILLSRFTELIYQYLPLKTISSFLRWFYRRQVISETSPP